MTTVTAGSLTQVATVGAAGSWTYDETLTSTYIVTTNYLRPDGTTYVLVQSGAHDYVIESSGDASGSAYSLTETVGDDFAHTRSSSHSSTQGDDQLTRDTKFDSAGKRGATFNASGTRTNRPGGGWSTTETQDYATTGDTGYDNAYHDHVTPLDAATTGIGVDSTGKQGKYGAYNSVRVIETDSDGRDVIRPKGKQPYSAMNPWGAGTLEWPQEMPGKPWSICSILEIDSRYSLWDQPNLQRDVDAGRFYLPDAAEGLRETLVTLVIDATPQQGARSPDSSFIPLLATLMLGGYFILGTYPQRPLTDFSILPWRQPGRVTQGVRISY